MQAKPVPIKQIQITNSFINLLFSKQTFHPEIIDSGEKAVIIRMDDEDIPVQLVDSAECEIMTADNRVRRGIASRVQRKGRHLYMTCLWKDPAAELKPGPELPKTKEAL